MMSSSVPLIDFSPYKLGTVPNDDDEATVKLVEDMYKAFSNIGFVYLKNHGIPEELVENAYVKAADFFSLDPEIKMKYVRSPDLKNHGYVPHGNEQVDADRPGDYKEAYDVNPEVAELWPSNNIVDGFRDELEQLYYTCRKLANRIMNVMAMGLGLEDVDFFTKYHNRDQLTYTVLRCLFYPIIDKESDLQPNQMRCGEHTDYGSLTLLFQDEAGGLQVFDREKNEYVPAPPIPGTVIVNLGDLMQRWTSDKLISTKHRVVNPGFGNNPKRIRRSIVCFVQPDAECTIECCDGTGKYPAIKSKDYILKRYSKTFK